MEISNKWVPVALSVSIEPGTSAGAIVNGAEIVVWRDSKGQAHVWEDRCPHRGMRMSFGFVRGDRIACLYHGWEYDNAGQCKYVPAHPDLEVPQTIKVATYAAAERNGVIWSVLAAEADEADLVQEIGDIAPVRSLYADCSVATALSLLGSTAFPGQMLPPAVEQLGPNYLALTSSGTRLIVALQEVSTQKTALHMVLASAESETSHGPAACARYAQDLRHLLETTPMTEVA
jgi:nitrite reductase/ring-hydroxylating ferredoxin subunit